MSREEFLRTLERMLEQDPYTLDGAAELAGLGWDSLAVMNFIALMDQQLGVLVAPGDIAGCRTVNDLMALAGHAVTR